MNRLILTAFMLLSLQSITAQNTKKMESHKTDQAAIRQLLENNYFNGIYTGNIKLLQQLFHPETLLFGDIKGQSYAKTAEQYLNAVANRQSPKDSGKPFKGEILSIRVVNSIAIAEVQVKMYDYLYHDLLSFHRIDGQWIIVNKMLTDVSE
jgi:hypothetical protein